MDPATAYRRRWATLGVLSVSLLVIGLDNTVLNVALPRLADDLDASAGQLQWVVDSYILVFAGLLLTAGSLGDRFGRRGALMLGLAVFGVASAWGAWGGSATELIAARAAMGIGGALIMPATLSILTHSFPDPKERSKAIGIWAAVSGIGIVLGPMMGGWLLEHYWWGSVFLVNVPVAAVGIVAAVWLVPESRDPEAPRLDIIGALLSIIGLASLVWSIIDAPARGWGSPPVLAGFATAVLVLGAFVAWELRAPEPMLDLRYFRDARFASASASVTLVFFSLFGTLFFLTQHLQLVLGYSPLAAGQRLLPIATMVLGAPLGVKLAERLGIKIAVATGLLTCALALAVLAGTDVGSGYDRVAISLALMGIGMGLTMAPATDAVMSAIPAAKAGVGSAVNDTTRQIGGAFGVAVLGSILSSAYTDRLSATLPEEMAGGLVPDVATEGLPASLALAAQMGGEPGTALAAAAREAFVHAMSVAVTVSVGVAVVGALVAIIWLPSRLHAEEPVRTAARDREPALPEA